MGPHAATAAAAGAPSRRKAAIPPCPISCPVVATKTKFASARAALAWRASARKLAIPGARSPVLVNQLLTGVDTTTVRAEPRSSRPITFLPGTSRS